MNSTHYPENTALGRSITNAQTIEDNSRTSLCSRGRKLFSWVVDRCFTGTNQVPAGTKTHPPMLVTGLPMEKPISRHSAGADSNNTTSNTTSAVTDSVRKDPSANNTVIFDIDKNSLTASMMNTELDDTTAAATISISGKPVTFYIRWGFGKECEPFLVARDSDFPSQVTRNTGENAAAFAALSSSNHEVLNSIHVVDSQVHIVVNLHPDGNYSLARHTFSLFNHPVADLTNKIQVGPRRRETTDITALNWKKHTTWNLSLANKAGKSMAELTNITFQDEAYTYLLDGHAMDGWRHTELHKHIKNNHPAELIAHDKQINTMFDRIISLMRDSQSASSAGEREEDNHQNDLPVKNLSGKSGSAHHEKNLQAEPSPCYENNKLTQTLQNTLNFLTAQPLNFLTAQPLNQACRSLLAEQKKILELIKDPFNKLPRNSRCDHCIRVFEQNDKQIEFWDRVQQALSSKDCPDQLEFRVCINLPAIPVIYKCCNIM